VSLNYTTLRQRLNLANNWWWQLPSASLPKRSHTSQVSFPPPPSASSIYLVALPTAVHHISYLSDDSSSEIEIAKTQTILFERVYTENANHVAFVIDYVLPTTRTIHQCAIGWLNFAPINIWTREQWLVRPKQKIPLSEIVTDCYLCSPNESRESCERAFDSARIALFVHLDVVVINLVCTWLTHSECNRIESPTYLEQLLIELSWLYMYETSRYARELSHTLVASTKSTDRSNQLDDRHALTIVAPYRASILANHFSCWMSPIQGNWLGAGERRLGHYMCTCSHRAQQSFMMYARFIGFPPFHSVCRINRVY